jgi:hypothetical protein
LNGKFALKLLFRPKFRFKFELFIVVFHPKKSFSYKHENIRMPSH